MEEEVVVAVAAMDYCQKKKEKETKMEVVGKWERGLVLAGGQRCHPQMFGHHLQCQK
jgi:hypothetical protein